MWVTLSNFDVFLSCSVLRPRCEKVATCAGIVVAQQHLEAQGATVSHFFFFFLWNCESYQFGYVWIGSKVFVWCLFDVFFVDFWRNLLVENEIRFLNRFKQYEVQQPSHRAPETRIPNPKVLMLVLVVNRFEQRFSMVFLWAFRGFPILGSSWAFRC